MNDELSLCAEKIFEEQQSFNPSLLVSSQGATTLEDLINRHSLTLDEGKKTRLQDEFLGAGPLSPLMDDLDIFDIIIQGPDSIHFENSQGLQKLDDRFLSEHSFNSFVERLLKESSLLINQREPFANGRWGHFRVHIVAPPLCSPMTITLRRHRSQHFTWEHYLAQNFLDKQQKNWLEQTIAEKNNILIVGPTGSGKTSFLNSLLHCLPENERVVIIEDTCELIKPNTASSKLLSRESVKDQLESYDLGDLLRQSLRMRPDRLVVGEVRGGEATHLLQALATGHSGSFGTLHADSSHQALLRLEMLIQQGAPQWSLPSIRRLIQLGLDYLIVLKSDRYNKGIKEIQRIAGLESFGLLLEPI